jgi:hypothetical protein
MRMRNGVVALAAVAVGALLPGRLAAQPNTVEPTVEIRLRSVNDLLDKAEYIGGLVDQEEPIKQVRGLVQALSADGKGIEGVDPKRPFGVYGVLKSDVESSPVVVMVPIADQARFLNMLKERLSIEPEKADGGTFKLHVPLINEVYFRFANDYLYVARDAKHLDTKGLIAPKTYFGKDDGAVLSVVARFDRIPDDLKTFVTGQLEHGIQEQLKKDQKAKSATEQKLAAILADGFVGAVKTLVDEGKELRIRLLVDPKDDDLVAEVVVTAKNGTTLARNLAGLSGKTSLPAGIVATASPVAQSATKLALTDELKKHLDPVIDGVIEDAVKQAKPAEKELARKVLTALAPTLKSGELDSASVLVGPDAKGHHALLVALAVKNGKGIEKLAKELTPMIPGDAVKVTFDVDTVGNFTLHKIELTRTEDSFERLFGTKTLWLAISDGVIAFSIEPDGALLRAGLKAKPAPISPVSSGVALAKAIPAFDTSLKPDEIKALLKDAFGSASPVGKDTIAVTVEGGPQLTIRLSVKGKAVGLAVMMGKLKGK